MNVSDWLAWNEIEAWQMTWTTISTWANSNFSTSLIGAFAGAAGGAWAAKIIAERSRASERIIDELRALKTSLEILFGVSNVLFNVKEQHVLGMKKEYEEKRAMVHEHHRKLQAGEIPKNTELDLGLLDMRTMDIVRIWGGSRLEDLIVGRLSVTGRPVPMFNVLMQTVDTLNNLIASRNALLASMQPLSTAAKVPLLFGLPLRNGMVDDTFGHYIEGIARSTDDGLYFATTLINDLRRHGESLQRVYRQRYRKEPPPLPAVVFDRAKEKGLMPPLEMYGSWESSFLTRLPKSRRRYPDKVWYLLKRQLRALKGRCSRA